MGRHSGEHAPLRVRTWNPETVHGAGYRGLRPRAALHADYAYDAIAERFDDLFAELTR